MYRSSHQTLGKLYFFPPQLLSQYTLWRIQVKLFPAMQMKAGTIQLTTPLPIWPVEPAGALSISGQAGWRMTRLTESHLGLVLMLLSVLMNA